jgi:hypothetical protein
MSFGLTQPVDFVAWPPKTQPKSPMTGEGQHEVPLVQGNLASQLKINTKKVFWPFMAWPPKTQQKAPRTG